MDWRYWITYEGVVSTEDRYEVVTAADESEAQQLALEDHENKLPVVEVEPLEGGEGA